MPRGFRGKADGWARQPRDMTATLVARAAIFPDRGVKREKQFRADVAISKSPVVATRHANRARREIREIRSAIPTRVELAKFRETRTRGRVALRFRGASSRSRARDVNFALKSAGRRKTAGRASKWSACGEWQLAWASVLPHFGGDFIENRALRGDFEDFGRFWCPGTLAPWLLGALEVLNFAKVAPQFQLLQRKKRKQFPLLGTKLSSRPNRAAHSVRSCSLTKPSSALVRR